MLWQRRVGAPLATQVRPATGLRALPGQTRGNYRGQAILLTQPFLTVEA